MNLSRAFIIALLGLLLAVILSSCASPDVRSPYPAGNGVLLETNGIPVHARTNLTAEAP